MADRISELASRYTLDTAGPHRVTTADQGVEAVVLWEAGRSGAIEADRGCMLLRLADDWRVVDPAWSEEPLELRIGEQSYRVNLMNGRARVLND